MKTKGTYKRILIVEVNWIGDVLFSTPFISSIRERFCDAYITCMVVPRVKPVLENNPHIDEIIVYDENGRHRGIFGKLRFINSLRKKKFDLAILLHRSLTRTLISILGGIKNRAGYTTPKRRIFLTHPIEPPEAELHKADYFLNVSKALGGNISGKKCEFFVKGSERSYIEKELSKNGIKKEDLLVVMNPGGNWPPKRWSEENFAKLGDMLTRGYKAKVAISGAPGDTRRAKLIKSKMKESAAVLVGRTNIKELAALMERADFVISGDSGPAHIACAMGSNTIALFGPTSPRLTGPYECPNARVIQKNSDCEVPCYDVTCKNYACMDAITVFDVVQVFEDMYEKYEPTKVRK